MAAHGEDASLLIFAEFEKPLHFVKHFHRAAFDCRISDREAKLDFRVPDFGTVNMKDILRVGN